MRPDRAWISCTAAALLAAMVLGSCGGNGGLKLEDTDTGPEVRGLVSLPNGRLASAPGALERFASVLIARVEALTGNAEPASKVRVDLVRLTNSDVLTGTQPIAVTSVQTDKHGVYSLNLPPGANRDVCRYIVQVGDAEGETLTRKACIKPGAFPGSTRPKK